jgi:chemotaxis protein histidine kinase CheA
LTLLLLHACDLLLSVAAAELKASVSFADAQRAVAEAKQHAKAKAAAMLQAATKNWAARLSAAQAERQQLKDQLAQVQQQQEALAQQLSESQAAHASDVDKLQQQLAEAHARCTALQHQLHDVAYSHQQQLEQARLEAEAEAAAVMLDAAAAASKHHRHQQHRAQRQSCEVAVQADSPAALPVHDVSVQTDAQPHAQPAAAAASAGAQPPAKQAQPEAASNADAFGMRQAVHDVAAAPADASAVSDQAMNGHTQRPASLAVDSSCGAGTAAAEAATPHSRPLVSCWGGAAGVDAADDGDDLCRLSSASDTPVAAAHAKAGTISRAGSSSAHTAAPESFRPGSAAGATSAAPPAPSSLQGLRSIASSPVGGADGSGAAPAQHAVQPHQQPQQPHQQPQQPQQQPQQQQPLQQQPQQQQPQQREPVRTSIAGQMSGWHAELLEQQAQLETLRLRLSQAQQQQGAVSAGLGGSSSSGGFTKGCQAVASSRTLLLAPFATSIGGSEPSGGVGVAGSPAGPIRSSSSPMTYQQRRAATQQAADAAPGAGAWGMHSLQGAPVRLSFGAAGGAGAAAPLSSSPAYRQPLPAASGSPANGASSGASPGLARLGDDVLGGLSLSRYHRERSKLQEARAKQHALLATRHEDQAAALRSSASMLGGGGAGGGVASDAAAAVPLQDPSRVA